MMKKNPRKKSRPVKIGWDKIKDYKTGPLKAFSLWAYTPSATGISGKFMLTAHGVHPDHSVNNPSNTIKQAEQDALNRLEFIRGTISESDYLERSKVLTVRKNPRTVVKYFKNFDDAADVHIEIKRKHPGARIVSSMKGKGWVVQYRKNGPYFPALEGTAIKKNPRRSAIPKKALTAALKHKINLGRDSHGNYFVRDPATGKIIDTTRSKHPTAENAVALVKRVAKNPRKKTRKVKLITSNPVTYFVLVKGPLGIQDSSKSIKYYTGTHWTESRRKALPFSNSDQAVKVAQRLANLYGDRNTHFYVESSQ